ncbi:hypothetical protein BC332_03580 [Capsicum chinense]|nr:hypothetical protein BC332_03580 [Capsicum chinense]
MLPLQPGLYKPENDDVALPYGRRWTMGVERNTESHHSLICIRDQIDHMAEEQVLSVHGAVLRDYVQWFLNHGRLLIGNPALKDYHAAGFVHSGAIVAALTRGLRKMLKVLLEWKKDPARALCGHEMESCGRGKGRSRPMGRPRNAVVHVLFNEPSSSTPSVPSDVIPDMVGPYSMIPMELPSRPVDDRPRRDVEAIHLSYGSAIGDGYMLDMPGPSTTQNIGEIFMQHTTCGDTSNYLFGHTNDMFDMLTSGGSLETLVGYARPASSGVHVNFFISFIVCLFLPPLAKPEKTGQGDILPTWARPPIDMEIEGSSSVVLSPGEDEFIKVDEHITESSRTKVPVMKAKKNGRRFFQLSQGRRR